MKEKQIEQHLVKQVKAQGGLCYKFTSPARRGVPDRIVIWPGNQVHFVELKAPGKKLTPLQTHECDILITQGCNVCILSTVESVDQFVGQFVENRRKA